MKIWLDDIRLPPKGWIHFKTIESLIPFVDENLEIIEKISLDHDLGLNIGTGYDFLNWLEQKVFVENIKKLPKIKIHSMNPVGKANMERVLQSLQNLIIKTSDDCL